MPVLEAELGAKYIQPTVLEHVDEPAVVVDTKADLLLPGPSWEGAVIWVTSPRIVGNVIE